MKFNMNEPCRRAPWARKLEHRRGHHPSRHRKGKSPAGERHRGGPGRSQRKGENRRLDVKGRRPHHVRQMVEERGQDSTAEEILIMTESDIIGSLDGAARSKERASRNSNLRTE